MSVDYDDIREIAEQKGMKITDDYEKDGVKSITVENDLISISLDNLDTLDSNNGKEYDMNNLFVTTKWFNLNYDPSHYKSLEKTVSNRIHFEFDPPIDLMHIDGSTSIEDVPTESSARISVRIRSRLRSENISKTELVDRISSIKHLVRQIR